MYAGGFYTSGLKLNPKPIAVSELIRVAKAKYPVIPEWWIPTMSPFDLDKDCSPESAQPLCIRPLIVDDDQSLRELLCDYLQRFGMEPLAASSGQEMRQLLAEERVSIVVLDLMLPGEDGLSLCRWLRAKSDIPILMLTARCEAADRIIGLELGADDYMIKPFEPRELVARIQSILRRTGGETNATGVRPSVPHAVKHFDGWQLDSVLRQLRSPEGLLVPLSNAEFRLLWVFLERPGRVLNREQLLDAARGRTIEAFDRSIDLLVSRLRQKLQDPPRAPRLLKTVRGEGYLFDARSIE